MPPRPLHYQRLLGRDIIITEQMDVHLVWTPGRIFWKPIPRYLLEPRFGSDYLSCRPGCPGLEAIGETGDEHICPYRNAWKCALGFLFSYAALLCYESDFRMAQEQHLLADTIQWADWRISVEQLRTEHIYDKIHARFPYGKLRLGRLNTICHMSQGLALRGYMSRWPTYGNFLPRPVHMGSLDDRVCCDHLDNYAGRACHRSPRRKPCLPIRVLRVYYLFYPRPSYRSRLHFFLFSFPVVIELGRNDRVHEEQAAPYSTRAAGSAMYLYKMHSWYLYMVRCFII